ncbi:hypothetical protein FrCorBMG51_00325 [Protofrankia coriariae]|uniref:CRISPR-associated protein Cmr3 n=1 Tax=Protofrankia coriariae TaxID=1562887 RepID=A0ABR5F8H5_9ACTN|nr:hypothetical protein FrCorBMG51_00325 [Protofrankia coriariae]
MSAWVLFHPLDVVTFRDGRPFTTGMTATAHTTLPRPTSTGGALRAVFGVNPLRIAGPVLVRTGGPRARVLLPAPADLVVDDGVPRRLCSPGSSESSESPGPPGSPGDAGGLGRRAGGPSGVDTGAEPFLPAGVASDLDFRPTGPHGPGGARSTVSGEFPESGERAGSGEFPAVGPGRFEFLAGTGEPSGAYLPADVISRYLDGDSSRALEHLEASGASAAEASGAGARQREPLVRESRLGIARHARSSRDGAGRTTLPGFLYQADFWRPSESGYGNTAGSAGVAFGCRVWFDSAVPPSASTMVRLGGEARQAAVTVVPEGAGTGLPALPTAPRRFPGGRVLLYLATPAVFRDGWLPEIPNGAKLRGACTLGPEVITGLDGGTRRARPLRWAVAAGSVYFLEFDDPARAELFARQTHGQCLPQALDRGHPTDWMRTVGFGLCLVGRW